MRTILLIRHGETAANPEKRIQGHLPIPLNSKGELQAKALGQALQDEELDEIISSDVLRASQTAEVIASYHGMPVRFEAGLRENGYGAFAGMKPSEIEVRYPEAYTAWKSRELDRLFPEDEQGSKGETLREVIERVNRTITRIANEKESGTVAVITHGGVFDCVYRQVTGMDLKAPRDFKIPNACISRFSWDGKALHLENWGDVKHLENLDLSALDEIDRR